MFFRFVLVEYKVIAIIVELVNENYEHQSCKKSVYSLFLSTPVLLFTTTYFGIIVLT